MKHDTCFINAGIGQWYCHGSERLKGTLIAHGFPGDLLIWVDKWPCDGFPREHVYTVKAAAFQEAIKRGYRTIIWGDSSIQALRNTTPFVEGVKRKGYWLGQSGHNAAQTCTDDCLRYFGVSRDEAEKIHDCATGLFGVCLDFEGPRRFIERFIKAGREGAFGGSRLHAKQSKDPRFKFGRQDQSCATIIAAQEGLALDSWQSVVRFVWDKQKPEHVFLCQGM